MTQVVTCIFYAYNRSIRIYNASILYTKCRLLFFFFFCLYFWTQLSMHIAIPSSPFAPFLFLVYCAHAGIWVHRWDPRVQTPTYNAWFSKFAAGDQDICIFNTANPGDFDYT